MTDNFSQLDWYGMYDDGWRGHIVPRAFSHPAKYARRLIFAIYQHAIAEGWLRAGDRVVDPFGGVALGGLPALLNGAQWTGVELEERFVGLGRENIALWAQQYRHMHNLGSAQLLQGDSRTLAKVVAEGCSMALSSPPYAATGLQFANNGIKGKDEAWYKSHYLEGTADGNYGKADGQLGEMPEGNFSMAVKSPPYVTQTLQPSDSNKPEAKIQRLEAEGRHEEAEIVRRDHSSPNGNLNQEKYGTSEGQLIVMPEGDFGLAVSPPPYAGNNENAERKIEREQQRSEDLHQRDRTKEQSNAGYQGGKDYGQTPGQLGTADASDFHLAVASPPHENTPLTYAVNGIREEGKEEYRRPYMQGNEENYGGNPANAANLKGDSFWTASRLILEQLFAVVRPGGHAIFVTKRFVRNKEIVEFPQQWAELCRAVGFTDVCEHRAWFTRHHGVQKGLFGNEAKVIKTSKKSFFRTLAEKRGSPRIDWEDVACFLRP